MSRSARHFQSSSQLPSRRRSPLVVVLVLLAAALSLVAVAPPAQADDSPFQVTMTPSSSTVASGDQLMYTINVTNTGGDITDDTLLTSQISGMTGLVLTSNVGTCSQTDNAVTCTAGTLAGFQSWRITIRGTVTAPDGATLFNGVTVTGNHESSGYETSDNSTVFVNNTSTSPLADLRVSVQGPGTIAPSGAPEVTYQLTVNNTGSANATDITVINTLPDGFTWSSAVGNSLFSCANNPPGSLTVVCTGGRVNAGSNATITIKGTPGSYDSGESIRNTAVVDPYDFIPESNDLNNTGSLVTVAGTQATQTGLVIESFTDDPDPVVTGDLLTYSFDIRNTAPTRADNVAFTDVTQGLDAASLTATTTHGVCTVTAPKVTCTQKKPTLRLNPGELMTVTITGRVTSAQHTLITNTATVTGVIKNKASTNTSRATTTVRPPVDLTVVHMARTNHPDFDSTPGSHDPFRAWDHFQYDVSVGNSGLHDTDEVVVRQAVAPGVRYLSVDALDTEAIPDGDLDTPDTAIVECEQVAIGTPIWCTIHAPLEGTVTSSTGFGTFRNFEINVVSPPQPGTISSVMTVDPGNAIFEGDESNNVSTISTVIETGIDLTIGKHSQLEPDGLGGMVPSKVAPSGTITYTIEVSNIGTQDATGVRIRDVLPTGTRFRSVHEATPPGDPGHNFTCSHDGSATGGDVTCVGGILRGTHDHTLAPDVATIKLRVFAPAPPGVIRNQVRVDPDGQIDELLEDNNINTFDTDIAIGGVDAFHEFSITKEQTSPTNPPGNTVSPSGVVEYDLVVTNTGSDVAFGVVVKDILPSGFQFRHAEDTQPGVGAFDCSFAGGVITCSGGTLDGTTGQTFAPPSPAGDSTRTIHVSLFAATQPGDYVNRAVIDPGNTHPEGDETNNSDEFLTKVVLGGGGDWIDLTVDSRQTAPVAPPTSNVAPSGSLQYTLDVKNNGSAVAFNVTVEDTLPTGSIFRDATDNEPGPGAFECTESGGVVTCTGGTLDNTNDTDTALAGDDERQIVINVFAPPEPGSFVNTAAIDPGHAIDEANETNNTDVTSTTVAINGGGSYRDLVVSSITPSTTTPMPGQEYTYEVTAANTGTNPAYNVVLRNALDEGAVFVRATTQNDFSCNYAASVLLCDGGVLDGTGTGLDPDHDSDAVITITVRAPQRHAFTYGLVSRADPANAIPEANEGNNSRSVDVTATSQVDLLSTVTSDGDQDNPGTVTFTVQNTGTAPATDVYIEVEMPVGVLPQNFGTVAPGWTCQIEENPLNKVTCHGDVAAGATDQFVVSTFVTADEITANAFVDPDNLIVESDETNNASQG